MKCINTGIDKPRGTQPKTYKATARTKPNVQGSKKQKKTTQGCREQLDKPSKHKIRRRTDGTTKNLRDQKVPTVTKKSQERVNPEPHVFDIL